MAIVLSDCISSVYSYSTISNSATPQTYAYLEKLFNECLSQYSGSSLNSLPLLYKEDNFPLAYNYYGSRSDTEAAQKTLIGWCFAMFFCELNPKKRNTILSNGYTLGGHSRTSYIYGWEFKSDPNVARLVGASIYVAMRGKLKPSRSTFRTELSINMSGWNYTICSGYNTSTDNTGENYFFSNLQPFMPFPPGPYGKNTNNVVAKPNNNIPSDNKCTSYESGEPDAIKDTLQVDYDIYLYIVNNYNISSSTNRQKVVQAIANKESEVEHLFGDNVTIGEYSWHPVYGQDTIGIRLSNNRNDGFCKFIYWILEIGSSYRGNLRANRGNSSNGEISPFYCRVRPMSKPGDSSKRHDGKSSSQITATTPDDIHNALYNLTIEEYDGYPTGYYDSNGNWKYSVAQDKATYIVEQTIWSANSFPSGHSSGIFITGMALMEMYPNKADLILKATNSYAIDRTICRYHWTSDTIIGRICGSMGSAVAHACTDYDDLINGTNYSTLSSVPAKPEGGKISDNGNDNPGGNGSGSGSIPLDSERPAMVISPNNDTITVSMASSLAVNGRETDIPWGGIGAAGTIKWKRDIIDVLNYLVKPVRDLRISGLAYNLLTSYSYFHNDICYDLKWLWAYYVLLRTNYYLLVEYKENVEDWEANEYNPFVSSFNTFSSDYTAALTALINGGPYYVFDRMSDPEYYSQAEADAYNYQLPGAIHTTDVKSEIVIPDEPTTTYSLSISVNNGSSHIVAGEKDTYKSGDVVQIALNSNTGYKLPSSYYRIIISGASVTNYNLSNNYTVGTLTIQISNNASITINCIAEGETIPASITFATATESYVLSPSSSYTITRQTPTIVYPNNDNASNYSIEYSVSDTSIVELNSAQTKLKVNGSGQAWIYATMKKNSDNSTVATGQYSIFIGTPQTVENYKLIVNVKNSVGRLNYDDDDNKIFIESIFIEPISFMVLYNNAQGIAAGQNRNISKDPSNNDIMYNGNDIENITDSSNIYINAGYGRSLQTSNPRSFKCYFQLGHPPVTKTTSNGVTTARIYIEAVDEYPKYSTISYITSDDNSDINDNHNINTDELNQAFISEKSTSKKSRSNSKSKDIINNDLIFGETVIEYYTLEECNEYNSHLPGAKHAGDIKVPSYPIYKEATLPTFPTLPSLPGPVPQISPAFDETLVPIEYFTYTWDKGIPTYNMPYEYVNMTDYIAYTPNVQNVWQTLSYSMLKWKNNQVDDHPALLYEFMDFDD